MLDPKDYQRLFQIELKYLISDLFAQHYKTLECLLICNNGLWTSYLPKRVVEQTMKDGQKLFESRELFKQFENDFRKYTFEAKATFEKILSQNLTEQNAERFLYTVADLWKFYSKTEFFYTDGAAQAKSSENLSNNLKAFEQIKSDGRLMLNALIFEENNYFNRFLSKVSEKFNIGTKELQYYSIKEI